MLTNEVPLDKGQEVFMHGLRIVGLLALVGAMGTGCETISAQGQSRRVTETRATYEVEALRAELQRIEQRVAGMEAEREMLHGHIKGLRDTLVESDNRRAAELVSIHQQLKAQSAEQDRIRRELADELGGRIEKILKASQPPPPSRKQQAGYVHVVKTGQTLSEIARAYNSKSETIIKANNLKTPNDIRVGQELFIPE